MMSHQLVHSDDIPRARQGSWMQVTKPILKMQSVSNGVSESVTYTSVPECGVCVGVGVVCGCGPTTHLHLASFPGPAQLFSDCGTEKWGEPGFFFLM